MSSWDDRTLLEDLLARGVDDWVYEAEVYGIAQRSGLVDPDQVRMLAVGLIAEALSRGLVIAGDYDGAQHQPWDCSVGEAVARIEEKWLKWGMEVPTPGALVWLDMTPTGQEIGEAVLAREQAQG
jgi:hypothetical protein